MMELLFVFVDFAPAQHFEDTSRALANRIIKALKVFDNLFGIIERMEIGIGAECTLVL